MSDKIDFVITWVDGNDPEWRMKKESFLPQVDNNMNSESRYRDWEILKYWFRSVEKNAPWVNNIFLITEGHLPNWLNVNHDKLRIIKHSDYISDEYLPTFNSNVIEINISKLPDLSEHFVLFNDDMFINAPVNPDDFFKNGLPRDTGIFSPIVPISGTISNILVNNVGIVNKKFNTRQIFRNNFFKFFNYKYGKHLIKNFCVLPWSHILGFYDSHIPVSYLKSRFIEASEFAKDEISLLSMNRFRQPNDISHWLVRYWQLASGCFYPRRISFGQMYDIERDFSKIRKDVITSKHKVICLEDGETVLHYEESKRKIVELFESVYTKQSKFER